MIYNLLGNTGISVSKIAFGTLTVGPLQRNFSPHEAGNIISYGIEKGINFIDTADLYENYPHIQKALGKRSKDVIIATKSYDYTSQGAKVSLEKALRMLKRDYIDIFMLHEQESIHTIRGHWDAIEYLLKEKEKGKIRALGISTHRIEGVIGACQFNELEVIHPIINYRGLGIEDGTRGEMENAILKASSLGKGVYAMKIFGGGNLIKDTKKCFDYIRKLDGIHSMAIGMQSRAEIDYNIKCIMGEEISYELSSQISKQKRKLIIEQWCIGCGKCVDKCHQNALIIKDNKARVIKGKCLLCGYCGSVCPQFSIKIV